MENEIVDQETLTPEEVVEPESTEVAEPEPASEELIKAKELAKNQKIRAEKAEQELKALKGSKEVAPKNESYSLKDFKALSDVHDDDVDIIVKFAKLNEVSISEAKANPIIQALLKDKQEKRETASATNTGAGRRGASPVPDDVLIDKANKGELKDDEMIKAAQALLEQKRKAARGT